MGSSCQRLLMRSLASLVPATRSSSPDSIRSAGPGILIDGGLIFSCETADQNHLHTRPVANLHVPEGATEESRRRQDLLHHAAVFEIHLIHLPQQADCPEEPTRQIAPHDLFTEERAPAMGASTVAAMPAAAPHPTIVRSCRGGTHRCRPMVEARAGPI